MRALSLSLALALALAACHKGEESPRTDPSPLMGVDETEVFALEGLRHGVSVIYTTAGVPHIYAVDRHDLALAQGFVLARDRWFQMDLVRRLSTGRLSELMGDVVLSTDLESRGIAMTDATDRLEQNLSDEQREVFGAYAEGFNNYIRAVRDGTLPAPSEVEIAAPLLGAAAPTDLMVEWTTRDVAAIGGTLLYRLGFETEDIGHTSDWERLQDHYAGADLEGLRQPLALELWSDVTPVYDFPSAAGFGTQGAQAASYRQGRPAVVERSVLTRAAEHGDRIQERFGRDHEDGWGSNAWAVAGDRTEDGRALLSGDGHLELDIPALMYQIGLDTEHYGGGEITQTGLVLVGMPVLSVGTNGHVAWSTTQHSGDITDWYAEQIQLGPDGMPQATWFGGAWQPVVRVDESYEIADVSVLGSVGRTVVVPRWTTFDGRWLFDIEGREAAGLDEAVGAGEAVVSMAGNFIVPADEDGDGVVTGISFDFTGLDDGNLFAQFDAFGHADDVLDFHEATRMGQALSQNMMAADANGGIYYSGYEMVPCRGYLPRQGSGWIDGADPTMLLDGTVYGGFEIPVDQDFRAIEGDPDPYRCVVPHADYPKSFTPDVGFLETSNQDPGGLESDGDRFNDPWHLGGPWDDGYRAEAANRLISEAIADGGATLADMSAIQGHHESAVARRHSQDFVGAIAYAQGLGAVAPGSSDERIAALYAANQARFDEVQARIEAWAANGHPAESGVQTFYHPTLGPNEADNAVATTIFNVWLGDVVRSVLSDEGLPGGVWQGGGSAGQLRVLHRIFRDRGPGTDGSAGWNPATEESVLFDDRNTPGLTETSHEMVLSALADALDFLESEPISYDEGGFGSTDMGTYIWGLRHQVEFKSLIGGYLDGEPLLASVFNQFAITTNRLPLGSGAPNGLEWFPRPGDNRAIDAANNGLSGRNFRHGSGPVMRMVFALGDGDIDGVNVIPGGQSGLIDSEHYDDQTRLWLANETLPVPITVDEVVEQALGRTSLVPMRR